MVPKAQRSVPHGLRECWGLPSFPHPSPAPRALGSTSMWARFCTSLAASCADLGHGHRQAVLQHHGGSPTACLCHVWHCGEGGPLVGRRPSVLLRVLPAPPVLSAGISHPDGSSAKPFPSRGHARYSFPSDVPAGCSDW